MFCPVFRFYKKYQYITAGINILTRKYELNIYLCSETRMKFVCNSKPISAGFTLTHWDFIFNETGIFIEMQVCFIGNQPCTRANCAPEIE